MQSYSTYLQSISFAWKSNPTPLCFSSKWEQIEVILAGGWKLYIVWHYVENPFSEQCFMKRNWWMMIGDYGKQLFSELCNLTCKQKMRHIPSSIKQYHHFQEVLIYCLIILTPEDRLTSEGLSMLVQTGSFCSPAWSFLWYWLTKEWLVANTKTQHIPVTSSGGLLNRAVFYKLWPKHAHISD